jgi:hypothetical protein
MRLKDRNPQILHMETLLAGNKGSLIQPERSLLRP